MLNASRAVSVGATLALLAGIVFGAAGARRHWWAPVGPADGLSNAFADAAARVLPEVATVYVESPGLVVEGLFKVPGGPELGQATPKVEKSLGAGVIVDPRGYLVTNRHVIDGALRIQVNLGANADHPFSARLVGVDPESDLAVVKIDTDQPLQAARFADSDRLRVGEWVEAVGSPFGLDHTTTAGIVSALHRANLHDSSQYEQYIQTDAAINPGNSGGPLINLEGEVVGINTAIYTEDNSNDGVGFALPSKLVQAVVRQLVATGKVTRGSIGVTFQPRIDPSVRRIYGLERGVLVAQTQKGGPAEKAGLEAGDVIVALNGEPIQDGDQLVAGIVYSPLNQPVQIGYRRDGVLRTASVPVQDRTKVFDLVPAPPPAPPAPPPAPAAMGLTIQDSRIPPGVKVNAVKPDSFADRIGVLPGDVIVEFNRQPATGSAQLQTWLDQVKEGRDVALLVLRPDGNDGFQRNLLGGPYQP